MAKNIWMTLKGTAQFRRSLKRYSKDMEKHYERGLTKAGTWLLKQSLKIVPVDTGLLRSSGRTIKQGKGFNTVILVGYFGVYYALYVHEDLNARHAKGKSAKYLEIPYRQGYAHILKIIRDECRKVKWK